jgi:S-DNA-T family DNA segregation ATPase FtsK/SpoIIIE
MAAAQKSTAAPLPAKLAGLLREARWLVLAAIAGYLALVFFTFHRGDPGWSHSAADGPTHNAGGRAGAWIADLLLYLFGVSAWWWVALCLVGVAWGYRSLDRSSLIDRRPLAIALGGFVLLLLASAALEALRLYSMHVELPRAPPGHEGAAQRR